MLAVNPFFFFFILSIFYFFLRNFPITLLLIINPFHFSGSYASPLSVLIPPPSRLIINSSLMRFLFTPPSLSLATMFTSFSEPKVVVHQAICFPARIFFGVTRHIMQLLYPSFTLCALPFYHFLFIYLSISFVGNHIQPLSLYINYPDSRFGFVTIMVDFSFFLNSALLFLVFT